MVLRVPPFSLRSVGAPATRRSFVYLTVFWLVFHGLDTATTLLALRLGLVESNPVPAFVLAAADVAGFVAWKWLWVGAIPLLCWALAPRWRLWLVLEIGTIAAQIAVLNNVYWLLHQIR